LRLTSVTAYRHVHENPEYSCGSMKSSIWKMSSGGRLKSGLESVLGGVWR
jgi:hypothetical protein